MFGHSKRLNAAERRGSGRKSLIPNKMDERHLHCLATMAVSFHAAYLLDDAYVAPRARSHLLYPSTAAV
jgi:hypothetical protein